MLDDKAKIASINLADVYGKMLRELPWGSLKLHIQTNAQLAKACTFGGHRLDPNQRNFFEKIVMREAEKSQFNDAATNSLFALWYPTRTQLHEKLEDYFHSEEYKKYREDNNLSEDNYELNQDKFTELFSVSQIDAWRILLCFSPMKFSDEQIDKILDNSAGNVELIDQLKQLQNENAELLKKATANTADLEKLRQRQQNDANEIAELKKQLRQARTDAEQNTRRLETAQAEVKRLQQASEQHANALSAQEADIKANSEKALNKMRADLERTQKELVSWRARYEEQRQANKQLNEDAKDAQRLQRDAISNSDKTQAKIDKLNNFADLILSRIDWPKIGAAMKMSPLARKNFNSMVKKLNYEEDMSLTMDATLPDFWNNLIAAEKMLVDKLAKSNALEVENGNVEGFWQEIDNLFADVQSNLEARTFLLTTLHEIFFQTFVPEDLNNPLIPSAPAKKK